jgi:PAN domain
MSPSETSSGSGNTTLVTIIVAIITVVGTITVAVINKSPSRHPPRQIPPIAQANPSTPSGPIDTTPAGSGDGPALNPQMGPLQINYSYMGGTDYRSFHSDNAAQCSEQCRNESQCVAMTLDSHAQICWLKTRPTQLVSAAGFTSATKTHQ